MGSILIPSFFLFAISTLLTWVFVPFARLLAIRIGAVDKPSSRRINTRPIPRMGGVAIFAGISITLFAARYLPQYFSWVNVFEPDHQLTIDYTRLYGAFVVIFLTGVIDDVKSLSPKQKLLGQILAACIAASSGLIVGKIVNPFAEWMGAGPFIELGVWAYPVTIIYLVGYVNVINLIDGLDGLAAGICAIAALTMFVLSSWSHMATAAIISVALAGACLGFLRYNFNPASIFMGDSGSLTLGFTLGTISLLSVARLSGLTTIIVPLVVAGIPMIDTLAAIIRRTRAHVSFATADRGHIHHRLIQEGYNQRQAVLRIYAWTGLLCAGTLVMTKVSTLPRMGIFVLLVVASAWYIHRLHLLEPVLLHHQDPQTGQDELIDQSDPHFTEALETFEDEHHHHHNQ